MLEVFGPGALNYFTFFRPILLTLSVSRNPILTHLPFSGFLHSDRTHSWFGILSPDAMHPSGGVVIIFVRQGLSFSELSISSLSSLDPYSNYVGVNISLNNSSSLSFLNGYAPRYLLFSDGLQNGLLFSLHSFLFQKSLHSGGLQLPSPLWDSKSVSEPRKEEVCNWVIFFDLLPLNDPGTPTLLHCSTGSLSFPDISFASSSLALSCSWEKLQDLGSDQLPILLSVPLSSVFRSNERLPSFNFQKARQDGFASYFDSLSLCRGILVSFSFLCCCSLYHSGTECGQIFHFFWPHQTPS